MSDNTRTDALTGRRVIVVPDRQGRPNLPDDGCPFCVGGREAPEPYEVRWFPNRWPSLGNGRAEVVLFSPDHQASLGNMEVDQVTRVVELWTERTRALTARDDVAEVLIFENRGAAIGATISHPHGQIYAFDDVTPSTRGEHDLASERDGCALCDQEPADRIVATAGDWRAWVPDASAHPYGIVLAPSQHVGSLTDLDDSQRRDLARLLRTVLGGLDALFDEQTPYMLWFHQRPSDGGAWPWAHLYAEIVPHRRAPGVNRYVAAAELGSHVYINSVDPLHAAARLRDACEPEGAR